MKKIIGILFIFLIIYAIYFDLTIGTLPQSTSQKVEAKVETEATIPYFEAKVEPGETLISIIEHQTNKSLSVSIDDLVHDFEALNPGNSPDKIMIGKVYRFPDYAN